MRQELYATLQKKIEAATGIKKEDVVEYYTDYGYLDTKFEDHVYSLADVLRAMGDLGASYVAIPMAGKIHFTFTELFSLWNLALPLHLQEDAVGEWLITVIK